MLRRGLVLSMLTSCFSSLPVTASQACTALAQITPQSQERIVGENASVDVLVNTCWEEAESIVFEVHGPHPYVENVAEKQNVQFTYTYQGILPGRDEMSVTAVLHGQVLRAEAEVWWFPDCVELSGIEGCAVEIYEGDIFVTHNDPAASAFEGLNDTEEAVGQALVAMCNGMVATQAGTNNPETIVASRNPAVIQAFGGNDSVIGSAGDDDLCGGTGADSVYGGLGWDDILGGDGNDSLRGVDGSDDLYGLAGHDNLFDGRGRDFVFGGSGTDYAYQCADGVTDYWESVTKLTPQSAYC